jgi:hypothetical protein
MELDDPFDNLEMPILQDFANSGWRHWVIDYNNPNQLELFDIYEYQKYDRFGKVIDKNIPRRDVIIK